MEKQTKWSLVQHIRRVKEKQTVRLSKPITILMGAIKERLGTALPRACGFSDVRLSGLLLISVIAQT